MKATVKLLAALALLLGACVILAVRVNVALDEVAERKLQRAKEEAAARDFVPDPRPQEWLQINTFNDRGEWIWADPNWRDHFKEQMRELDTAKCVAAKED